MEKEFANLIIETHGSMKRMEGILNGEVVQVKENTKELHEIKETMVSDEDCHKRVKSLQVTRKEEIKTAVMEAMDGKKRSRWLVIKDILLIILGPAGGAGFVVLLKSLL